MKYLKSISLVIFIPMLFMASPAYSQKADTLSLQKAIHLALKNNRLLKISKYQVAENKYKLRQMKSKYLPRLTSQGTYSYSNHIPLLTVDQGSFGVLPGNIPLPATNLTVLQGKHETYSASVTLYQPLSQLIKVNSGVHVAGSNVSISQTKLQQNRQNILLNVRKLYYGLEHEKALLKEKQADIDLAKAKLRRARVALKAGKTLKVSVVGLQANILDKKHDVITCQNKIDNYWYDLKTLTGLKSGSNWVLTPMDTTIEKSISPENKIAGLAMRSNPEVMMARYQLRKAGFGVQAARRKYLPDIGGFAQYKVQRGIPITPRSMGIVGLSLKWNIFTFGDRSNGVKVRDAEQEQAQLAFIEQQKKINGDVRKTYRNLQQSIQLIQTAQEAVRLRKEELHLAENKHETGLGLPIVVLKAKADLAQSESDLIGAVIQYKLAKTKLNQLTGQAE